MKGFEIVLKSPIPARDVSDITDALDVLYQAEFAAQNGRFPNPSEQLYLDLVPGSFKIKGFSGDEGLLKAIFEWIVSVADSRHRKDKRLQLKKLETEVKKLDVDVSNIELYSGKKEELALLIDILKSWQLKNELVDRTVETAKKIETFYPGAGAIYVGKMLKGVNKLFDAFDRDQVDAYRFGSLE